MKELHPLFQEIIENALSYQVERERNKVVKAREFHPETYMEIHESRDELRYDPEYERGPWF